MSRTGNSSCAPFPAAARSFARATPSDGAQNTGICPVSVLSAQLTDVTLCFAPTMTRATARLTSTPAAASRFVSAALLVASANCVRITPPATAPTTPSTHGGHRNTSPISAPCITRSQIRPTLGVPAQQTSASANCGLTTPPGAALSTTTFRSTGGRALSTDARPGSGRATPSADARNTAPPTGLLRPASAEHRGAAGPFTPTTRPGSVTITAKPTGTPTAAITTSAPRPSGKNTPGSTARCTRSSTAPLPEPGMRPIPKRARQRTPGVADVSRPTWITSTGYSPRSTAGRSAGILASTADHLSRLTRTISSPWPRAGLITGSTLSAPASAATCASRFSAARRSFCSPEANPETGGDPCLLL